MLNVVEPGQSDGENAPPLIDILAIGEVHWNLVTLLFAALAVLGTEVFKGLVNLVVERRANKITDILLGKAHLHGDGVKRSDLRRWMNVGDN